MHSLLEKLRQDHRNLEKILNLLSSQLDHFFAGGESDFDLKIELLEYLEAYADLGHHPIEDIIFAAAMDRAGEKRELLERLKGQHGDLGQLTRTFRKSLENIYQDGVMSRAELEIQGREYVAAQRHHLETEEKEAFPMLDGLFTEDEWAQMQAKIPKHEDPVFEAPDKLRFQTLFEYLTRIEAEVESE